MKFPSYKNRTFYIAGESYAGKYISGMFNEVNTFHLVTLKDISCILGLFYAGKYVPELAALIHEKNSDEPTQFINLKGILVYIV